MNDRRRRRRPSLSQFSLNHPRMLLKFVQPNAQPLEFLPKPVKLPTDFVRMRIRRSIRHLKALLQESASVAMLTGP
jgi:hypothetical protein